MRAIMFVIGVAISAWGLLLWRAFGYPIWLAGIIGLFNIILGAITPKSRKVDFQPETSGAVKLVVDKVILRLGRLRFTFYELVFLDNKLVMKKLTSMGIIFLATGVSFAVGGFFGGLTGLSVWEFLDQRKRDRIRDRNEFTSVARGDREVPYESMSQVQLDGESLKMVVGGRPLVLSMAPEYPPIIARRVREVIPNQSWARAWSPFYP